MTDLGTPLKSRPGKLCVNHHNACDCREEVFAEYVDAIAKLGWVFCYPLRPDDECRLFCVQHWSNYEQPK